MRQLGLFPIKLAIDFARRFVLATLFGCAFAPFFFSIAQAQLSARTVGRSLDQLMDESDLVVRGSVVSSLVAPHPGLRNLMTVVVTMAVSDTYKGRSQKTIVFRQYIGNVNGQSLPSEYRKGQELLLLLRPVSEYGLTSPAGLEQGRFEVRFQKGKKVAVNGRGNIGLFDHVFERTNRKIQLSPRAATLVRKRIAGPVAVEDLEDIIRTMARAR